MVWVLGKLLLGSHTLRGRERDAAKDDLPAPGVGGDFSFVEP